MKDVHPVAKKMRLPLCAAPMFLVTGPDLVVAACRAGIMGAFPTPNVRTAVELDRWMAEITGRLAAARAESPDATVGPWAANLVTHSTNTRLADDLALVAKYRLEVDDAVRVALEDPGNESCKPGDAAFARAQFELIAHRAMHAWCTTGHPPSQHRRTVRRHCQPLEQCAALPDRKSVV